MNQKNIGSFLKILRKEKNLTQEQLAEQFNVSADNLPQHGNFRGKEKRDYEQ